LHALDGTCAIATIVVPPAAGLLGRFRRRDRALLRASKAHHLPLLRFGDARTEDQLREVNADLFCVATFPSLIPKSIYSIPRLGTLNVHPSLLPRHRGPDPLFWTYFDDDDSAGVTVHWLTDRVDGGPILAQERVPLPRAFPVTDLYRELSERGARLLAHSALEMRRRRIEGTPQDEEAATADPGSACGAWQIDFVRWNTERLWHFLRGLSARRQDLLPVAHGMARFWTMTAHSRRPGAVEKVKGGIRVYARDGYVELERATVKQRFANLAESLRSRRARTAGYTASIRP